MLVRSTAMWIGIVVSPDVDATSRPPPPPMAIEFPRSTGVAADEQASTAAAKATATVPPPRVPTSTHARASVRVAVGLSPAAPGSHGELEWLNRLETTVKRASAPAAEVRRLRAGSPTSARVCRERRDDLVIQIGYVPERAEPVVLTHDCSLDRELGVRAIEATRESGLVAALWDEHHRLVRAGAKERRRGPALAPRARGIIIAGVALVVIGIAVGVLVASTLRDDQVVLTVSP